MHCTSIISDLRPSDVLHTVLNDQFAERVINDHCLFTEVPPCTWMNHKECASRLRARKHPTQSSTYRLLANRGLVTRTLHTLALMRGTACVKTGRLELQTAVGKPDWDHSSSPQISELPTNSCRLEGPFSTAKLQLWTISRGVRYQVIIRPSWLL